MKLKKLLTSITALTATALLLTACSGDSNNKTPSELEEDKPAKYLTIADFTSTSTELTEVPNISAYFSRFNYEESSNLREQIVAASVASYLDNTAYSFYFMADWWGEKDDHSDKGFNNFKNYVSDDLLAEIKTLNKEKDKTPLGEKYFFYQPFEGYSVSELCFDTWEEVACMYPYKTETLEIISSNNHRAVVEVTTEYTVYVVDEYGGSNDQTVTYRATLELENNKKLTDIKEQPFYTVKKVDGGYTYAEPTEAQIGEG